MERNKMHGSLAEALEKFNRKERNILVRDILGDPKASPPLSVAYRLKVARALGDGVCIPKDAHWFTDYHISWLAGALAFLEKGPLAVYQGKASQTLAPSWGNPSKLGKRKRKRRSDSPFEKASEWKLVEGNQEDVDLVIATGSDLILIEAKGTGRFDEFQLESKLQRLDLLYKFYKFNIHPAGNPVRFSFILTSPEKPSKLDVSTPEWVAAKRGCCKWVETKGVSIPWIHLDFGDKYTVERCDEDHVRSAEGDRWHIIPKNI
jgi:hypothetical protein